MKLTHALTFGTTAVLVGLNIASTFADGCMMPSNSAFRMRRERSYINEPEQKALIYFHNGTEDLVISPSFQGAPSDFAWVVPVPAIPKVEVLRGAPFHELVRWAFPQPIGATGGRFNEAAKSAMGANPSVQVIEEKNVGAYHVAVLRSTDSNALGNWLADNQYHLPEAAIPAMNQYIHEGWTFVASKIKNEYFGNGLSQGVLAPLRLTFAANHPIYPMRLSAANPYPFKVLIFLAYEPGLIPESTYQLTPERSPITIEESKNNASPGRSRPHNSLSARKLSTLYSNNHSMPSVLKLCPYGVTLFVQELNNFSPQNCTKDLEWTSGNSRGTNRPMYKYYSGDYKDPLANWIEHAIAIFGARYCAYSTSDTRMPLILTIAGLVDQQVCRFGV